MPGLPCTLRTLVADCELLVKSMCTMQYTLLLLLAAVAGRVMLENTSPPDFHPWWLTPSSEMTCWSSICWLMNHDTSTPVPPQLNRPVAPSVTFWSWGETSKPARCNRSTGLARRSGDHQRPYLYWTALVLSTAAGRSQADKLLQLLAASWWSRYWGNASSLRVLYTCMVVTSHAH